MDGIDNFFKITERGSSISTEIRAGVTSFLTLSYLLLVNPKVMGDAGIPPEDVVTGTCISCCLSTIVVGLFGNLPFVMAPGLGLSAFFTYGLVNRADPTTAVSWEKAMAYVGISGIAMFMLSITFLVDRSMKYMPNHIKLGTIIGIGMLLACIGFESAGLISNGQIADMVTAKAWPVWLSLGGLLIVGTLSHYNVKGGILIGVVTCSVVYWSATGTFPKSLVALPALEGSWLKFDTSDFNPSIGLPAIATFLLVALFDCSGCLVGLSMKAGLISNVSESVPGGTWALIASGVGTMIAACTGCSPIIIAVECTAGILEGGKTGLTALTAAFLFAISLFFSPLFGAVPMIASAPVLILIGTMMMREVGQIEWAETRVALPAFLTISLMPLSHSISNGVWFGLGSTLLIGLSTHKCWDRLFKFCGDGEDEEPNAHVSFRVMTPTGSSPARAPAGFRAPVFTQSRGGLSESRYNRGRGDSEDDDATRPLMINDDSSA
mmetsp:Transcript_7505/g.14671  ORF Transcript_7505/g.14671 Transcript_7505/m.14671 type:complete len:493 (+) Transcript_7505:214-1692(+)|eukprot:CAMPEP_0173393822 /NCGR_PEP_ID=MMETSP1356-20130122/22327_1 /TAXON_ID=77927 ORGANISM="Hemiselmis virescens, Strain PCC157" /NCGR_SAMPLE_ID=MMETSP1356 /ASSEMBLY_ACC=CAM_ASM_000847 /LENGTH=492 /DNA_ID=CAMNT_0014351901 /DNA_START=192 /DNA_END=1670 /DNA_ORIENTATION=+